MTAREAAAALGVTRERVIQLVHAGELVGRIGPPGSCETVVEAASVAARRDHAASAPRRRGRDRRSSDGRAPDGLSVAEAAERLGMSEQRVRQLLEQGRLNGEKSGRRWRVDGRSVGWWLRRRTIAARGGRERTERVQVKLTSEQRELLRELAAERDRSLGAMVGLLVEAAARGRRRRNGAEQPPAPPSAPR